MAAWFCVLCDPFTVVSDVQLIEMNVSGVVVSYILSKLYADLEAERRRKFKTGENDTQDLVIHIIKTTGDSSLLQMK